MRLARKAASLTTPNGNAVASGEGLQVPVCSRMVFISPDILHVRN